VFPFPTTTDPMRTDDDAETDRRRRPLRPAAGRWPAPRHRATVGRLLPLLFGALVLGGCPTGVLSPGQDQFPGDPDAGPDDPPLPGFDAGPGGARDGGGGPPRPDAGPQSCDELDCGAGERCVSGPGGVGVVCEDATCGDDLDCQRSEWCDQDLGLCQADTCAPGASRCMGETVELCPENGAGFDARFTCGGDAYFDSSCTVGEAGEATCPCEDDWDCPAFTACESGRCTGTGVAPTCLLDPFSFEEVLPNLEDGFPWGGTGIGEERADGSPYPDSAQVVMPPLVVNLDDDNEDGLIDELDFPEIVFTSFCGSSFRSNGVLRAIHGGGANKGGDFFASCGGEVWNEGDPVGDLDCSCSEADLNATASLAAGDLDGDGRPEIVSITEGPNDDEGAVRIHDRRGHILAESRELDLRGKNPSPALANLDLTGPAEIVVGRLVFTVRVDDEGRWSFGDVFEGTKTAGVSSQGPIACVADIAGDARPEIVGGSTAYRLPRPPAGVTRIADCPNPASLDGEAEDFCLGRLTEVWDAAEVNSELPGSRDDGFCAIADVLGRDQAEPTGPDNPPDGRPEVLTVVDGWLNVFDGASGTLLDAVDLEVGSDRGGPPNVDDFDGDGFPEVGTAGREAYAVADFQPPTSACPAWDQRLTSPTGRGGNPPRNPPALSCTDDDDCGDPQAFACNEATESCVCLHNGWRRTSEDGSSRVTGSSVFDFNGDGRAEVIYNDECFFRVFDGLDGREWFVERAPSRTRTEYPVVADADNDGNAEIIFATSNESGFCNDPSGNGGNDFNNGIEMWGDDADTWVPARRIWNQHAYHVTNVLESGGIPRRAPESWGSYGGRSYNVYRSNPRTFGIAPDLLVENVGLASPDAACGALGDVLDITARVANRGDVRVGPGVAVGFYGRWAGPPEVDEPLRTEAGEALTVPLTTSLEPGGAVVLTARWNIAWNDAGTLPDEIRVVADDGAGIGAARECREDNNDFTGEVVPGEAAADLLVSLGPVEVDDCPDPTVRVTVENAGVVPARDVRVDLYAGNPFAGGTFLASEVLPGPIAAGETASFTATLDTISTGRELTIWAWVNRDRSVVECNEGNNTDAADPIECPTVLR